MQTPNRYLKRYYGDPVPCFSFDELEYMQNDETLNRNERAQFKEIYLKAKDAIDQGKAIPSKIVAFVRPESGVLALTIGQYIKINGDNDFEISYDELVRLAFDVNTPENERKEYEGVLHNAQQCIIDWKTDWSRFIFLRNKYTGKMRIWFD